MDILDDMGVSKLLAKAFSKVNYSIKCAQISKPEKGQWQGTQTSPRERRYFQLSSVNKTK